MARSRANWSSFIHPDEKMKVTPPARPAIKRPQRRNITSHTKVLKRKRKKEERKVTSKDDLMTIYGRFLSFENLND